MFLDGDEGEGREEPVYNSTALEISKNTQQSSSKRKSLKISECGIDRSARVSKWRTKTFHNVVAEAMIHLAYGHVS